MNGSLSDGNENIVDIFVLSTNTTDSPLQARDLENLGYRATSFSNAQQLFESLRSGKPNLLICDSVTLREDSYDLCRAIKADYDLWVVPVLIITSASNLSDLLHVLDCNADNFLSFPYDPSYFSALVEGMLTTPVERPTAEQIKTQFKIQHDDHQFVVTADRRRLLEFLLSSFEIAVNRSGDIIRITGEKDDLSSSLQKREERVRDQARSIEALNGTLRQKEQAISALSSEVTERDTRIQENLDRIHKLEGEIDEGKSHITAAEAEMNRLTREAADLAQQYTTDTGDLSRQLATISEHLAATSADLKAAEESLALETSKKTDAETLLSETASKKEQAEKMAHELALESEQTRADLSAAKDRIQTLETEIATLSQTRNETEAELARTISDLKETTRQLEADLSRQNGEIDEGKNRISTLELQLANLTTEKEQIEGELRTSTDTSKRDLAEIQETLNSTRATLERRDQDLASLNTEFMEITGARDAAVRDQERLSQELSGLKDALAQAEEARRDSEERMNGEIHEREAALQQLRGEHQSVRSELDEERNTLNRVRSDLDSALATKSAAESALYEASARIQSLESELRQLSSADAETRQQARDLQEKLGQVTAELDETRKLHNGTEADLSGERQEKERIARDLDTVVMVRTDLESQLDAARARIGELESGLKTAATSGAESGKQVHALADELEHVKAELENSLRLRHTIEESLTGERLEKEQISTDLKKASQERESLAAGLEKETKARRDAETERERLLRLLTSAETEGKSQETSLSDTIRELKAELEASHALQQELEGRVSALSREKLMAEEKASDLSREIDQARTALADEWEGHVDAQERLDAAVQEKPRAEPSFAQPGELESEKAKKRALIVKGPDLPVNIGKRPQSLSAVQPHDPAISSAPRIRNVEDLFEDEDDKEEKEREDLPSVSIVHEAAGDDADEEESPFPFTETGEAEGATPDYEQDEQVPDDEVVENEAIAGDDTPGIPEEYPDNTPSPEIAFNRAQWFDLLKWAHHSGTLTQEQRMQIVRMGRLIQKGRKLTHKQEEQVKEMLILVQAQGYRFI